MKNISEARLLVRFNSFVWAVALSRLKPSKLTQATARNDPVPGPKKSVVKADSEARAQRQPARAHPLPAIHLAHFRLQNPIRNFHPICFFSVLPARGPPQPSRPAARSRSITSTAIPLRFMMYR